MCTVQFVTSFVEQLYHIIMSKLLYKTNQTIVVPLYY